MCLGTRLRGPVSGAGREADLSATDHKLTVIIMAGPGARTASLRLPVSLLIGGLVVLAMGIGAGSVALHALLLRSHAAVVFAQEREALRVKTAEQEQLLATVAAKEHQIEGNLSRLRDLEATVRQLIASSAADGAAPAPQTSSHPAPMGGPDQSLVPGGSVVLQELFLNPWPGGTASAARPAPDTLLLRLSQAHRESLTRLDSLQATAAALGDRLDYLSHRPKGVPVPGEVTSPFGWRPSPFTGLREWHGGIDLSGDTGDPVRATADGQVAYAGWLPNGYGLVVRIDHGYGFETLYAHNSKLAVNVGDHVGRGQVIADLGSTGHSTGPHVHYEIHLWGQQVNPEGYIR